MPSRRKTPPVASPVAPRPCIYTLGDGLSRYLYLSPDGDRYGRVTLMLWACGVHDQGVGGTLLTDAVIGELLVGAHRGDNHAQFCTISDHKAHQLLHAILGGLDFSRRAHVAAPAQQAA